MNRKLGTLALAAALPLALSACGGGGSTATTTNPVSTTPAKTFQDNFGTAFAADFNADPFGTPVKPSAADVPALNLSALPLDN